MSQKRRVEGVVDAVAAAHPSFTKEAGDCALRWCGPHLAQSIWFRRMPKSPGVFEPLCGWQFFFTDERRITSLARLFCLGELLTGDPQPRKYIPNATAAELNAARPELEAWIDRLMLPLLNRFDSLEKLVAAYEALTAFRPFYDDDPAERFHTWEGHNFGLSLNWRCYNLAHSYAALGRLDDAIAQMEIMAAEYPADPDVPWQVQLEETGKADIARWRAALSG